MDPFRLALLILGLVLLLLASVNVSLPRVNFGWLGLFFIGLTLVVR